MQLRRRGYSVVGAASGRNALAQLARKPFDLLVTDIRMPGMSGLELLRRVRQVAPDVACLVVTAYGGTDNAVAALELGALGFVCKPVSGRELVAAVESALLRGRLQRENARLRALLPLFEVSRALLSELDEERVKELALEAARKGVAADATLLLFAEEGRSLLEAVARWSGSKAATPGLRELATAAVEQRVPLLRPAAVGTAGGGTGGSYHRLALPLVIRGEVVGVMAMARRQDKAPFPDSDLEFLTILGCQAAIAVQNARLFERVRAKQAEVERLLDQVIATGKNERRRLSVELHDGPLQGIIGAQLEARTCETLARRAGFSAGAERLAVVQNILAQCVRGLRQMVRDLHPPESEPADLVSTACQCLESLKESGVSCHLDVRGKLPALDTPVERIVCQIVREALTNVRKHARARRVRVRVHGLGDRLLVLVADDGRGFEALGAARAFRTGHIGLRSMQERAVLVGGELRLRSVPGKGCCVRLVVPSGRKGKLPLEAKPGRLA